MANPCQAGNTKEVSGWVARTTSSTAENQKWFATYCVTVNRHAVCILKEDATMGHVLRRVSFGIFLALEGESRAQEQVGECMVHVSDSPPAKHASSMHVQTNMREAQL